MKHSAETRAKIGAKARGRIVSDATRAKMRASHLLHPPAEDCALMVKLYDSLSLEAVADRIGYSPKVVRRVLHDAGVAIRRAGFQRGAANLGHARRIAPPEADAVAMVHLYAELSLEGVARRVGYCRRLVERVLRERGVKIRPRGARRRIERASADKDMAA